ncbi:MAG: hypothetical protein KAS65_01665 [Candidatus Aminicenantes bacterium]|nr:hypothetical protein [Candidatus Aminicenantes bacterium]
MKKINLCILILLVLSGISSANQAFSLKIGLFQPSLSSDLWDINIENLAFGKQDMLDLYYGAEYEFFLGSRFSISFNGGTYNKTIYSQYKDWEYEDGNPILQNLSLRITSLEANLKLYPTGHKGKLYPFIGIGAGIFAWRYAQWGDFLNFEDLSVQEGYAETSTYTLGFNALAGIGFRFNRSSGLFFEAKYQYLKGELSSFFEGFEKLDLSGLKYNLGFTFFFW